MPVNKLTNLKVITEEGDVHKVPIEVLNHFGMIKSMLESVDSQQFDDVIHLKTISCKCFKLILDWIDQHQDVEPDQATPVVHQALPTVQKMPNDRRVDTIPEQDFNFISRLRKSEVFELMEACNYLQLELLIEYLCKLVAQWLEKLTVEQVWQEFNIKSDFTPEENERIKHENDWADDCLIK